MSAKSLLSNAPWESSSDGEVSEVGADTAASADAVMLSDSSESAEETVVKKEAKDTDLASQAASVVTPQPPKPSRRPSSAAGSGLATPPAVPRAAVDADVRKGEEALKAMMATGASTVQPTEDKLNEEAKQVLKTGELKVYKQLQEAIDKGKVEGPLDQRWRSSDLKIAASKKAYEKCTKFCERTEFKLKWAKRELNRLQTKIDKGWSSTQEWQRVDTSKGEYLTYGAIAEKYGILADRERALHHAMNYCSKAAKLAGEWCFLEAMSEAPMFLFMKWEFKEDFRKAWSIFSQSKSSGDAADATDDSHLPIAASEGVCSRYYANPTPTDGQCMHTREHNIKYLHV